MRDQLKRAAATAAIELVEEGMLVGLGTGSTADHVLELLGERVAGGLTMTGVSTSERTATRARELGIPLRVFESGLSIDLAIDGADEVSPQLDLIKGPDLFITDEVRIRVSSPPCPLLGRNDCVVISDLIKGALRLFAVESQRLHQHFLPTGYAISIYPSEKSCLHSRVLEFERVAAVLPLTYLPIGYLPVPPPCLPTRKLPAKRPLIGLDHRKPIHAKCVPDELTEDN